MQEVYTLHDHLGRVGGLFKMAIREGWGEEIIIHLKDLNKTQRMVKRFILKLHPDE